jgi:hypothetical protein
MPRWPPIKPPITMNKAAIAAISIAVLTPFHIVLAPQQKAARSGDPRVTLHLPFNVD